MTRPNANPNRQTITPSDPAFDAIRKHRLVHAEIDGPGKSDEDSTEKEIETLCSADKELMSVVPTSRNGLGEDALVGL
jgi:hypothetical protein